MADGVPEIENRALSLLALILGHDRRLDLDGAAHDALECRRMLGKDRRVLRLEKREVRRVGDHAVLHRFGESRRELHAGERRQQRRIGHDDARLVKGAQQILPGGHVHARLATDGRVDHREQRRRDLHERYPA